jgi:3-oxoacyl-[acyl-carrier protein] reductase
VKLKLEADAKILKPSTTVPLTEYTRIMETNTLPLYHSAAAAHPHFARQRSGVFINISSISAPRPRPNLVWYAGAERILRRC